MAVASKKTTIIACVAIFVILIVSLKLFEPEIETIVLPDRAGESYGFWSIMPPIIAIGLALATKRVYISLLVGVLSGTLIYSMLEPDVFFNTTFFGEYIDGDYAASGFAATLTDTGNIGIIIFLILLGAFVFLMRRAGGTAALGNWARQKLKTRESSQIMTVILGIIVFVDDYFNCLTVGTVMKPVTDEHRVSRAKLAYLIDATAAPICIIAPISSWAAAVSGYINDESSFETFISTIPYNFYAILTIVFLFALILLKVDFGPMKKYEQNAVETGDLFSGEKVSDTTEDICDYKGGIIDLVVPIVVLITCCVLAMIYTGYMYGERDLIDMFGSCDSTLALPLGAFFAFIITLAFYEIRGVIRFEDAWDSVPEGFKSMFPAILVLCLAWTLKGTIDLMGADLYVADMVNQYADGMEYLIPVAVFIVAMFLAFATGTSWGTFGILIPICMALFIGDHNMMVISMSACMAGAVFGDHCSPISDTTIMASAGAECDLITHVKTQIPYALIVAAISAICFVLAGMMESPWIPMLIGIILVVGVLFFIKMVTGRKTGSETAE